MKKNMELICICCPLGCMLTVKKEEENGEIEVFGNTCKRGEDYAKKELENPTRIVTSTVLVEGGEISMVSVKTVKDIPKKDIFSCMKELKDRKVQAPIYAGDIVIKNVAGTGVDIIATKTVAKKEEREKEK